MKVKYPRATALAVARELVKALAPVTIQGRLIVAGSLRRRKAAVGDVEIVYVPYVVRVAGYEDFFTSSLVNHADKALADLLARGILVKRRNALGSEVWGDKNKLAVHPASGVPVDLFAATDANWFNYLVCRTGSAENNTRIAIAANGRGWKWNPYGPGFTDNRGECVPVRSEREVFELAGLAYLEPWER